MAILEYETFSNYYDSCISRDDPDAGTKTRVGIEKQTIVGKDYINRRIRAGMAWQSSLKRLNKAWRFKSR